MSEKKWYAVYTRPRWEKKVSELLTKNEFENYCPLNKVKKQWADRKKIVFQPLFTSYVFVKVKESEHFKVLQTDGIFNLVYWLGKPAVIREPEIELIKKFLNEHHNIKLEKTRVSVNDVVRIVSGALHEHEGQVVAVKGNTVKVMLPSLGYMMCAEVETSKVEVITAHGKRVKGNLNKPALSLLAHIAGMLYFFDAVPWVC